MKKELKFFLVLFVILSIFPISAYTLKVTEEHPFLVNGKWVSASDLIVGDSLITSDGKNAKVKSIKEVDSISEIPVYNLEDSLYHNYVVFGDIVVHNSDKIKDLYDWKPLVDPEIVKAWEPEKKIGYAKNILGIEVTQEVYDFIHSKIENRKLTLREKLNYLRKKGYDRMQRYKLIKSGVMGEPTRFTRINVWTEIGGDLHQEVMYYDPETSTIKRANGETYVPNEDDYILTTDKSPTQLENNKGTLYTQNGYKFTGEGYEVSYLRKSTNEFVSSLDSPESDYTTIETLKEENTIVITDTDAIESPYYEMNPEFVEDFINKWKVEDFKPSQNTLDNLNALGIEGPEFIKTLFNTGFLEYSTEINGYYIRGFIMIDAANNRLTYGVINIYESESSTVFPIRTIIRSTRNLANDLGLCPEVWGIDLVNKDKLVPYLIKLKFKKDRLKLPYDRHSHDGYALRDFTRFNR